jgi:hypothetical protein
MQFLRVSWKILVGFKDLLVLFFLLLFFLAKSGNAMSFVPSSWRKKTLG